jgi:hypothetical protein
MIVQPSELTRPVSVTPDPPDTDAAAAHPEEVDPAIVEKLAESASAAASEGTGVCGNVAEITIDPPPPPPPMAPPAGL